MQQKPIFLIFSRLLISLLLALTVAGNIAQGQSVLLKDSLDRLLSPWQNKNAPGISVAVVKAGQVLYSKHMGMANISARIPIDSTTTFWIASVSKQFTAAAVYYLVVSGKVRPDQSIRKYLPELPPIFSNVTVSRLLHHTSGIRDGFVLTALSKKPPSEYTNQNVLYYLGASQALNFKPGSRYEYNNSGYVLLATLVERVANMSFDQFMKTTLFGPLKMNSTYISASFPTNERQAEGYQQTALQTYEPYHFEGRAYGSTGVITSLNDLVRWSQFLNRPATVPMLASIVPHLFSTGVIHKNQPVAYGGGLEKLNYRGRVLYEHFGADEGFKADLLYFPESHLSVIGMVNNSSYYGLLPLLMQISNLVHEGRSAPLPFVDESETLVSEEWYYNKEVPQLQRVLRFPKAVRVSEAASGYAAPYQMIGDTLRSLDPIPAELLQRGNHLQRLDPYYHINTRYQRVKPDETTKDLNAFAGEYYSAEVSATYKIIATDKGLHFEFIPGMTFPLVRLTRSDFQFDFQGPNYLQFDGKRFFLSREGCRRLMFEKR